MGRLEKTLERFLHAPDDAGRFSLSAFHGEMENAFREAGFRSGTERAMPSILVLRLDAMGDNILTTPVLRELRRNHFSAHITLVTSPAAYPLMELCPYVNEVLCFQLPKIREEGMAAIGKIAGFCREHLWQRHYDLCLCPCWGSKPTEERFLAYLSGARERWGYSDLVNNFYMPEPVAATEERYLLNHATCNPPEMIHEAERYLYLLEAMGMTIRDRHPELWLGAGEIQWAEAYVRSMREGGSLIALCVGAKDLNRKYPLEQWIAAMEEIIRLGGNFVVLGGPQERADGEFLRQRLPEGKVRNMAGRSSMRESVALISLSDLYMGNVTGMMHAAAACGRPVITIFREAVDREGICTGVCSEYRRFSPYMTDCVILRPEHAIGRCRDLICYGGCNASKAHCIAQVRPEEIVEAYRILMG